jgi:protein-disulfide isomerase
LPNHANASFLATAAICAGEQHRYWEMHDRIFETQATSRAQVSSFVDGLAIDLNKFNSCLDGYTSNNARIEMDIETARRLGFKGTPAFALGRATSDGGVRVQTLLLGALSFAEFDAAINNLLESKN